MNRKKIFPVLFAALLTGVIFLAIVGCKPNAKSIVDFPVNSDNCVIYDGRSWVYNPVKFRFRVLTGSYEGGHTYVFKAAFFPEDGLTSASNLPKPRYIFVDVYNIKDKWEYFRRTKEGMPVYLALNYPIRKGDISFNGLNSDGEGRMVLKIWNPGVASFYTPDPEKEPYNLENQSDDKLFGFPGIRLQGV